jgi:hypothetical protein
MNKFKIIFKVFLVISIIFLVFIVIVSILAFLLVHVYIYLNIFYKARPAFELQGRLVR